jgi:enoyl-CoA hydratase/carnithine racemase
MSLVQVERYERVTALILNRPERMNALGVDLVGALSERLAEVSVDPGVSCVVLAAAGDKAFCTGADLKEREAMTREQAWSFLDLLRSTFQKLEDCPVPTIAAIHGYALGGGLELALCCDLRVASESAVMGLTEVRLGIIPGAGGTQRLPRVVGESRARRMVFSGERLSASEAAGCGLVEEVVDADQLYPRALELASVIALGAPLALRAAKRAMCGLDASQRAARLDWERACYAPLLDTEDRNEALAAFRQKRTPRFLGR